MDLSVVIPCFNEEGVLRETHRRLLATCSQLGLQFEIIFVNDGSTDSTWTIIEELFQSSKSVVGINLARNYGFQSALAAGLNDCRGDRVLILDADLQDPPELLPKMWELMSRENAHVVYGQRTTRQGETLLKKLTAAGFYRLLSWLTDVEIPVDTGDFRLMDRKIVDALNALPEQNRFLRGLVCWVGFKHVPISYRREARFAGATKFNYRRMFSFAIDGITSFSIKPLRLSILFGGFLILLFAAIGFWALRLWYVGIAVPGWTSLIMVQLLIGSIQFLVLGIIGEYIGRIFVETKRRPLFVIADIKRN